jgi:phosphoglycolate phosphatase-like HAD superfamily hydrolase
MSGMDSRHLIVDLDGTLIRLRADWAEVRRQIADDLKKRGLIYDSSAGLDANLFRLREVVEAKTYLRLLEDIGSHECRDLDRAQVNPDLIGRLKHAGPWALLTANNRSTALAVFALPAFREVPPALIVGREDVSRPKPDPEGGRRILAKMNWPAERTTLIGDSDKDETVAGLLRVKFERIRIP